MRLTKKMSLAATLLLTCTLSACNGDEIPPPPKGGGTDLTLTCKTPDETGGYTTFFKPNAGWVGDPMPFFNKKDNTFYVFYLQDWRDGRPNEHPIYYTTTKDYAKFTGFYQAIPTVNDQNSQELLLGTGCFFEKDGIYYSFYTGYNGHLTPKEKIMIATSTDMRTWDKRPLATFEAPAGYDKNNFRDPQVYFDPTRNCYVMLVTAIQNGKGCLARFTSSDLLSWTNIEPLTSFDSDASILECSDIFQIGSKWYLTFSRINRDAQRKTFYRIADSPDGPWRIFIDVNGLEHDTFDGLFMYAGKTSSDGTNRYISGWCSTDDKVNDSKELGWAGSLVTHKIVADASGRLTTAPVDGVLDKFSTQATCKNILSVGEVSGSSNTFTVGDNSAVVFNRNSTSFKITMNIDARQATKFGIGFDACDDLSNTVKIEFDSNNKSLTRYNAMGAAITSTPLNIAADKRLKITVIAEKSVCTVYVDNQIAFTNRIYKMNYNPWMIYSEQGTTTFSDIKVFK